jgi:hypothetical protein
MVYKINGKDANTGTEEDSVYEKTGLILLPSQIPELCKEQVV